MLQRPMLAAALAFALGGAFAIAVHAFHRDSPATEAAHAFLSSLDSDKLRKARYPFDSDERFNWHFIPKERNGLSLKEMSAEQQRLALALVQAGVSADGAKRVETIRALENVLHEIEQGRGPTRDPELYFVTVFGEPSDHGIWGWRYEGHHTSLQWTMRNGAIVADTPQFLGANPAEVREGPMKGTRVLAAEEDLAYEILHSLNAEQRKVALVKTDAPADIITGASRRAAIQEDIGVSYTHLNSGQKKLLEKLIAQHAKVQSPDIAHRRWQTVQKSGLDNVKFAWMGGLEKGQGHYYRIQGKTFLIEFDNTQDNANHIHTVWRDFAGDFGRDLLAEHYSAFPHTAQAPAQSEDPAGR